MAPNQVAIITGASSGIGAATARLLAANGYAVVLAARRFERLQALAEQIQGSGGQAFPISVDVSRIDEIDQMIQRTLGQLGQVDVLFNNAGFGRLDWLENLDPVEDIESQLQVNLVGVIQATRAVLPHMISRRSGHIVNMASLAGFIATPTYSIYAASKFAVRGFTEALRREVGIWNIHVSAIYPGGVSTEFSQHTGAKRKTGATTPAALRLSPEQVAHSVLSVLRRPRRTVIIPWPMRVSVLVNSLFPGLTDRVIEQRFCRPERGL
jgi:short-subunit dehydrogenase